MMVETYPTSHSTMDQAEPILRVLSRMHAASLLPSLTMMSEKTRRGERMEDTATQQLQGTIYFLITLSLLKAQWKVCNSRLKTEEARRPGFKEAKRRIDLAGSLEHHCRLHGESNITGSTACLHYAILCCTALHSILLHCTALYCTALHCTVLHCIEHFW